MSQVAAKKRDLVRRGSLSRRVSRCRDAGVVGDTVPRHRYRFQHGVMQMNMMRYEKMNQNILNISASRSKDEMTVADMHSLVYDMMKK